RVEDRVVVLVLVRLEREDLRLVLVRDLLLRTRAILALGSALGAAGSALALALAALLLAGGPGAALARRFLDDPDLRLDLDAGEQAHADVEHAQLLDRVIEEDHAGLDREVLLLERFRDLQVADGAVQLALVARGLGHERE